ncbi:hypothetical protein [Parashewanella tropica]|uniref:hypothetical protein n=1 Tax=Parashewanella tropica TaxID=2547970 RepID=UPI001059314F|nr:hypothetical protein [Parashewanella tropica]
MKKPALLGCSLALFFLCHYANAQINTNSFQALSDHKATGVSVLLAQCQVLKTRGSVDTNSDFPLYRLYYSINNGARVVSDDQDNKYIGLSFTSHMYDNDLNEILTTNSISIGPKGSFMVIDIKYNGDQQTTLYHCDNKSVIPN